jgi:hypothetical protein
LWITGATINAVPIQGHSEAKVRKGGFPVDKTREQFERFTEYRKIQDRALDAPDSLAVVGALQAKDGGHDLLRCVHQFNLVDKHRTLIPVGAPSRDDLEDKAVVRDTGETRDRRFAARGRFQSIS